MNVSSDDPLRHADKTLESRPPELKTLSTDPPGKRVLIVENDTIIRDVITFLLERRSYTVRAAVAAEDVTALLEAENFDVVLLEPSGNDVLSRIAAARPELLARIIVLKAERDWTTELPVHAVVMKPFEVGELTRLVDACANVPREPPSYSPT